MYIVDSVFSLGFNFMWSWSFDFTVSVFKSSLHPNVSPHPPTTSTRSILCTVPKCTGRVLSLPSPCHLTHMNPVEQLWNRSSDRLNPLKRYYVQYTVQQLTSHVCTHIFPMHTKIYIHMYTHVNLHEYIEGNDVLLHFYLSIIPGFSLSPLNQMQMQMVMEIHN